jgi:VWFA-related protein
MRASLCVFVSLIPMLAQQNPPAELSQRPAAAPAAAAQGSILLDVAVTDKSGKPVTGLTAQDFTVIDNKRPQKIASFQEVAQSAAAPKTPVQVFILLDGLNARTSANLMVEQQELLAFLKKNAATLPGPTSILLLGQAGVGLGGSSARDAGALIAALNTDRSGELLNNRGLLAYGTGGGQQLSLYTLDRLADYETGPGRKLAIWISPGWPLLPTDDDITMGLNTKQQKEMFATIVAFTDKLRRDRLTLYQIDPSGLADADSYSTSDYKQYEKGLKNYNQVQTGALGLQILADQTGGRVLNSSNDISGELAKCLADAEAYYTLSFDAPKGDGPNELHTLEIKLGKPGLTARTRTEYYAQP